MVTRLFIDGDAFPNALKALITRAIERTSMTTVVVSNKRVYIGNSRYITYVLVDSSPDEADDRIVEMVTKDDLVITADIPLADRVLRKGAFAIDHRGQVFDQENIGNKLASRDLMQQLRDMGMPTRGPEPFSKKDAEGFANKLNQLLTT